jgi:hypothetical protein
VCRNIKPLYNLDPPADAVEIHEAALQYVRKVSGYRSPSVANEDAFRRAVDAVAEATSALVGELETHAPPRTREQLAEKARERASKRFEPGQPAE